ncbi:MAG: PPOX class F420-dependent oxidoreductase [Halieaceae bacterium]|jgi:PPOX class probable F420-dependent enzyme|nr:PPOX class F420-dependent oxidoreductase [Halieaceae bacterium]
MSEEKEIPIAEKYHDFLNSHFLAMLTTMRADGMLSTNPVGYVWDGQRIRISTLRSRMKSKNILHDSRVCFCVQSPTNPMDYVEVRGHATLEEDPDRSFFREQFRRGMGGEDPPEGMDPPDAQRVIVVIHPTQVSAPKVYGGLFDHLAKEPGS